MTTAYELRDPGLNKLYVEGRALLVDLRKFTSHLQGEAILRGWTVNSNEFLMFDVKLLSMLAAIRAADPHDELFPDEEKDPSNEEGSGGDAPWDEPHDHIK